MPINEQREIIALRTATTNLARTLENFSDSIVPQVREEEVKKEKREEESQKEMVSSFKTGTINVFKWMGGLSKRFWQSEAMGHLKRGFSGFFSKISSTMTEIMGPLAEFVQIAKDMVTGVIKYVGSMAKPLLGLIGKGKDPVVKAAQKTQSILKSMLRFMKGEEKRAVMARLKERLGLKIPRTKKQWLALIMVLLGAALFALGAAIGGVARAIILPFQVLWKVLKGIPFIGKKLSGIFVAIFKWIGTFVSKIIKMPIISRLAKIFGPVFKWLETVVSKVLKLPIIRNLVKIFGPIFKWLGTIIPKVISSFTKIFGPMMKLFSTMAKTGLIQKLVSGLKFGFKVLGWPIMILLGLIDFIKGFVKTEGDLFAKIMGGIKTAFLEFFELPIKLFGWLADKVLGWFGVSIEGGVGKKVMGWVSKAFDMIEYGYRLIFALISDGVYNLVEGAKAFILGLIPKWLAKRGPLKGLVEKLQPASDRTSAVQKNIEEEKVKELERQKLKASQKVIEDQKIRELERQKLKAEQESRKRQEENQKKIAEETKKLREEQERRGEDRGPLGVSAATAVAAAAKTPTKEIEPPDEIESIGIWLFNQGGAG